MLKEIEIDNEKTLETEIWKEPNNLESGLKIIRRQFPTDSGPLDILCVDSDKRLAIIELKINEDDSMLIQAFRYFDYINENLDAIKNMFTEFDINAEMTPRIILVSKSFSNGLLKTVKNISEPIIELYTYNYLEVKDGSKELFIKSFEVSVPKKPIRVNSLDDHVGYIRDERLREFCQKYIDTIRNIGNDIEVVPTQFYIGLQFKGRLIAIIYTYRERFDIVYPDKKIGDDWENIKISEIKEIPLDIINKIKNGFKEVGGRLKE